MAFSSASRARCQATLAFAGSLLLWWRAGGVWPAGVVALALALALLAWRAPAHYAPVQRALDRLARRVLAAFTWLVLGLVYFGLFTPLRLWRTLLRRDPLRLRRDPAATTYLQPMRPAPAARFDRPF